MTEEVMTDNSGTFSCHQISCPQAVMEIHSSEPISQSFETICGAAPNLLGANALALSRLWFGTIDQASRAAMFMGPTEMLFQRACGPRNDQPSNDPPKPAIEIVETAAN